MSDLYVPGQKHRVRLWLRGGPAEGLTILLDFATGPDWVPGPGFSARINALLSVGQAKMLGKGPAGAPIEDAEDGTAFFWSEITCMRYEGPVQPQPKIITARANLAAA